MTLATLREFSWQEVEARGNKPWTTQQKFSEETDTESMSESAAAYARAAGETKNVDDLAKAATEISQEAGNLNGAPLVKDGRFQESHRALQRGGSDMDAVVRHIIRSMNHAIEAEKETHRQVYLMNDRLAAHNQAARNEWQTAGEALGNAIRKHEGDGPVTFSYGGKNYTAEMSPTGVPGGSLASLPQVLADEIRNRHLGNASKDAAHYYDLIADAIEQYRRRLMWETNELAELGYELGDGPLKLFTTPEMARYAAGLLKNELNDDKIDPELIEYYTRGLRAITEGIFDGHPPSGDPERPLSPGELTYLSHFYGTLDANSLAKLGSMEGPGAITDAKRNVANGIQMLLNPEIGGLNPAISAEGNQIPQSIRHFVYDYKSDTGGFQVGLKDFNGFGGLMGEATVPSGERFSADLAHAAIDVEKWATRPGALNTTLENTGSSGMLEAASRNPEAAANLLNDSGFRTDLLSLGWDDSTGAAAMVKSGTIPPQDVPRNSPESQKFINAAYNVLTYTAQHRDDMLGLHDPSVPGVAGADLTELQRSIGNTTLTYMDLVSRGDAENSGVWATTEGQKKDINNKWFQYGFELSQDDRQNLFAYMNKAEDPVKNEFFTGVGQWQQGTAYYAFAQDHGNETSTFRNIGTIAGAVAEVQGRGEATSSSKGQYTAMATISALAGATNTLGGFNPATSAANSLGAYGINEILRYSLPDGNAGPIAAHETAIASGDIETRVALANAYIAANPNGVPDGLINDPRRNPNAAGYNDTDLSQWAYDVLGKSGYLEDLREAYKTEQGT
jgi:hypothetical protein